MAEGVRKGNIVGDVVRDILDPDFVEHYGLL